MVLTVTHHAHTTTHHHTAPHHRHTSPQLLHAELRSPTEQESTPSITALFQEFFLRLVGAYRESVVVEGVGQPGTDLGGDDVIR